jgi:hypothetical protein
MTVTNLKAIALRRRDTFFIDPRLIQDIDGLNERIDYGDLAELKASIEQDGVADDLTVRIEDGHIGLIKGYRRMRCVRELIAEKKWKHKGVPCKSEPKAASEQEQLIGRLIEQVSHNTGKPYTILEQGRVFRRLLTLEGVTTQLIEKKTGLSRPAVKNALLLAEAEPQILKEIAGGHISESLVIEFIREADGDQRSVAVMVEGAIANAAASGKKKASRKHAGPKAPKKTTKNHKTNWEKVPTGGGAPGGGGGADRTSFDAKTNVNKLNKLMEELERDKCDDKCYDTVEAVIDFLEGKKTVSEMKNYLKA